MALVREQRPSLLVEVRQASRPRAIEIGKERDKRARQRRMLGLELVSVLCQILHTAGEVQWLVVGVGENIVCRDDPDARDDEKNGGYDRGAPVEKGEQATLRALASLSLGDYRLGGRAGPGSLWWQEDTPLGRLSFPS